jgi:hypothetical protein
LVGIAKAALVPLKPIADDLAARRPVWLALSDLFLDTDTSLSRVWRIETLAASPYSMAELEEILLDEVFPACGANLLIVAGEWAGFDQDWLERRIVRCARTTFRVLRPFRAWQLQCYLAEEWRATEQGVVAQRAEPKQPRESTNGAG